MMETNTCNYHFIRFATSNDKHFEYKYTYYNAIEDKMIFLFLTILA